MSTAMLFLLLRVPQNAATSAQKAITGDYDTAIIAAQ